MRLTRKTNFLFKESLYARKNSGSPGYKIGGLVLTGDLVSEGNNTEYIAEPVQGFNLKGADNNGMCYFNRSKVATDVDIGFLKDPQ